MVASDMCLHRLCTQHTQYATPCLACGLKGVCTGGTDPCTGYMLGMYAVCMTTTLPYAVWKCCVAH